MKILKPGMQVKYGILNLIFVNTDIDDADIAREVMVNKDYDTNEPLPPDIGEY